MHWTMDRVVALAVTALLVVLSTAALGDVDPDMVGLWQRQMPTDTGGTATLFTDISSDGACRDWVNNETVIRESGEITTTPGSPAKYHIDFDSGTKDDGTYEVRDHSELRFTNSTGTSVYQRTVPYLAAPPAGTPLMLNTDLPSWRDLIKRRAAVAEKLWPQAAKNGTLLCVQLEQAAEDLDANRPADALPALTATYPEWIRDVPMLNLAAWVRLGTNDPLDARGDFDRILMARPDLVPAYLGRALACAKLGAIPRMKADLAIAKTLDAQQADAFISAHQQDFDAAEAHQPNQSAVQLCGQFFKAAAGGADAQALLPIALQIYRATNAVRRLPPEWYQDGLRLRSAVIETNPNDPQAWANLATYLYLEGPEKYGRGHTDGLEWVNDRLLSMRFCDEALSLDPHNITAMATKAWLFEQDNQERDALNLAEEGLDLQPGYPRFAKLQSILLTVSSIRATNEAARQRAPKTWSVITPDWIITFTRPPTQQELAAARQFDSMSAANMSQANQGEFQAWQQYQNSIGEMDVAADYYDYVGQSDKAMALWNQILKLDPNDETALIDLDDYYQAHQMTDQEFETRLRLDNIFGTTVQPITDKATNEIAAHDYDAANHDLARALDIDPTDTLTYALLGRVALATRGESTWWAFAHCGEAVAMAGAELAGVDFSPNATAPISVNQANGILNIWNGELSVATHDGMTAEATKYRTLIANLQHRIIPVPTPPPSYDYAAVELAQQHSAEHLEVLIKDNEMDAAAKCILSGVSGEGVWHGDISGPIMDVEYPLYLYLRPRLYHFQLWHYFGPGTLQRYDAYAQSHTGYDPNDPPSKVGTWGSLR